MILWDVKLASEEIKDLVEDGICDATDPRVLRKLNEAIRRLIIESDWKGTLRMYRICVSCCCITMPRDIEAVREVFLGCRVGRVEPAWYEFLEHGPGVTNCCTNPCGTKTLIDMGIFPTHAEPIYALPLVVVSDCREDNDIEVILRGVNEKGSEITDCTATEYSPGEVVQVNNCDVRYTNAKYAKVTAVQLSKPARGMLRIFSWKPDTFEFQQISVIHPGDTRPAYRRYKLPGNVSGSVAVLAKITANQLHHPSDVLPIQNIDAIRQMLRAIKAEDALNLSVARDARAEAIRILTQEKKNYDGDQKTHLQVQGDAFALDEIFLGRDF